MSRNAKLYINLKLKEIVRLAKAEYFNSANSRIDLLYGALGYMRFNDDITSEECQKVFDFIGLIQEKYNLYLY